MSGKVYAEKNAGRRIKVYASDAGPRKSIVRWPTCYVVGYDDHDENKIYVEMEDAKLHQYCTPSQLIPSLVRTSDPITPGGRVWGIYVEQVRFLRAIKNKDKEIKLAKPYPHTCTKCHAPARKFSTYTMCSNGKCKSNKKFKQSILSKVPKFRRLRCGTCRGYAVEVGAVRSKDKTPQWRFNCAKRHTWTLEPKDNDIVSVSLYKSGEKDRIFSAGAWKLA